GLLGALGVQRCIIAGGSGGARDSMLTTMLYPEVVEKLVVWNIVGGIYGTFVLGSFYIVPSILAARGTGMDGGIKVSEWRDRIEENPNNKQRFLDFDKDDFLAVMLRWLNAFLSRPDHSRCARRDVRPNPGAHVDHSRRRERLGSPQADVAGSQLSDQGIEAHRPALARGRVGACVRRPRRGQGAALQYVRHLGASGTGDPRVLGPL